MRQAFFKFSFPSLKKHAFGLWNLHFDLDCLKNVARKSTVNFRGTKTGELKLLISGSMSRNVTFGTTGDADGSKRWSPPGSDAAIGTWPS